MSMSYAFTHRPRLHSLPDRYFDNKEHTNRPFIIQLNSEEWWREVCVKCCRHKQLAGQWERERKRSGGGKKRKKIQCQKRMLKTINRFDHLFPSLSFFQSINFNMKIVVWAKRRPQDWNGCLRKKDIFLCLTEKSVDNDDASIKGMYALIICLTKSVAVLFLAQSLCFIHFFFCVLFCRCVSALLQDR